MILTRLSIVIPCYNEEKWIVPVLEAVLSAPILGLEREILVINDGSTDGSLGAIAASVHASHPSVRVISKRINEGKGAALRDGFLLSTGDIVLVQDADLEYSPAAYTDLLRPFMTSEVDVVYGSRLPSESFRRLFPRAYTANVFLTWWSNIWTGLKLHDMETGYKVFRGPLIRELAQSLTNKRFGFEPEITALIAREKDIRLREIPVQYAPRGYAEGKKIGWKDGFRACYEIPFYTLRLILRGK